MEAKLTALDTATVEADGLREFFMDLPIIKKPLPAILMNCDSQMVIVKVDNSKDNMKSSRHIKYRESWRASWALHGLTYYRETFAGNTYELWQSNGDSQSRQFKGQYEVIKTH
jgi:hypothetical protein